MEVVSLRAGTIEPAVRADEAVFTRLFDAYHGAITGYLYHLVGDRDLADDLAQETFLNAYRALGRVNPDGNLRAWLYRIATNAAISHFRRQRRRRRVMAGSAPAEPADEPRLAERLGERELLEAALRRIGPGHATALLLRHHQGLSLAELADALGMRPGSVKVRLYRARRAFIEAYRALAAETAA
ncbi:MAG TPA: RNA polymerase sigma factor [Thermomicrobiales bacterium]|nr:RNA polymerase sigma factor [Thermomicrobiales bacterium]